MTALPKELQQLFTHKFSFPEGFLFGTVSTYGTNSISSRTMRVYNFDTEGRPVLLTHTHSNKWKELNSSPQITICFTSDDKLCQILLKGTVNFGNDVEPYWDTIRPDLQDYYKTKDNVGIIKPEPTYWESLELAIPYTNSIRTEFHPSPTGWSQKVIKI